MKIKSRLSLYCTLTFGIIFAITSLLIYGLYYTNTKQAIYKHMEKTAFISAWFYLEEDELSSKDFEKIRSQFEETAANANYQVYDSLNYIAYGNSPADVPIHFLDEIRHKETLAFEEGEYLCFGIFYEDNQGDFVIVVKEKKEILAQQMKMLHWTISLSFILGLLAIVILSRFMAKLAYKPFTNVIDDVKNISTNNLNIQIHPAGTQDELDDLIATFNNLLTKISDTVIIQKNFVRYVSHEFKTPLTALLGNMDLFTLKERTAKECQELTEISIKQVQQIKDILNALIVISDLRSNEDLVFETRVDTVMWEIAERTKAIYPNAQLFIDIDILPEDEQMMTVDIDDTQLLMALYNLIENAVKYSNNKPVSIKIFKDQDKLVLSIVDNGIGIPQSQLDSINKPFFRSDNSKHIDGEGIGLSIAVRILEKNNVIFKITSAENLGTRVILIFP